MQNGWYLQSSASGTHCKARYTNVAVALGNIPSARPLKRSQECDPKTPKHVKTMRMLTNRLRRRLLLHSSVSRTRLLDLSVGLSAIQGAEFVDAPPLF